MTILKKWITTSNYLGKEYPEYYVFLTQHRDSKPLRRSNFICALNELGGKSNTILVVRANHWGVGWVEFIGIHESDTQALAIADGIQEHIEKYTVLNDDHFSQLEWDEATSAWENYGLDERVELCKKGGVSIFAARYNTIPMGGCIEQYLIN